MNKLPLLLFKFLKMAGIHRSRIDKCDLNTRLYHDLGIYGEVAEDCMDFLAENYKVDLTNFDFNVYFPSEYPGKSGLSRALLWQIPFARYFVEKNAIYEPLTLAKIEAIIHSKQWPASGHPVIDNQGVKGSVSAVDPIGTQK